MVGRALCILLFFSFRIDCADMVWNRCVRLNAECSLDPSPQIKLSWISDLEETPISYVVYRKLPNEDFWGLGKTLPGNETFYIDTDVEPGRVYEYQVVRTGHWYTAYGYILSAIRAPAVHQRGTLIFLVEASASEALKAELSLLEEDLVGDGWFIEKITARRDETVTRVKDEIKKIYQSDPEHVKSLFIFGHIPVPYSGNVCPDEHTPKHQGAWPSDAYYGDMDGEWTDKTVNITVAKDSRNHNVPGDGKFDQSEMPSPIELEVGRVDFANLPGRKGFFNRPSFPDEIELLRRYLQKDHLFRHLKTSFSNGGIISDSFGAMNGEAFAVNAWRNFPTLIPSNKIECVPDTGEWVKTLHSKPYLWAYGCGGGTFETISGLGSHGRGYDGTTLDVVQQDMKAVFFMLFGSWLGDWDSEDNIMKAVMATPSYGLTCSWAGRPHWFYHRMGLNETIGSCARLTQNNGFTGLYRNQLNLFSKQIHIALLGDPTLRMSYVAAPESVAWINDNQGRHLTWKKTTPDIDGFYVYKSEKRSGPYELVTIEKLESTDFLIAGNDNSFYMVRSTRWETTPSGSFENLSEGVILESPKAR